MKDKETKRAPEVSANSNGSRVPLSLTTYTTKLTWTEIKEVILIVGAVDVDVEGVKQFGCRLNDRLAMFGDQEKRKAMEALKVRVVAEPEGLRLLTGLPMELSQLATRFRCERRGILPTAAS